MFVFAAPLTLLCYGPDKIAVAWFVRVLSLWGLFQSVGNPAGILMVALGRTDLGFNWTLVRATFTILITYIVCQFDIQILAYSQVVLSFIFMFAYWRMVVYKMIQLPISDYFIPMAFPVIASLIAASVSGIVSYWVSNFHVKLLMIMLFGIIYMLIYRLFKYDYIKTVFFMVFKKRGGSNL
jgi:O-antigen/teichoic acid export membrane protein